MVQTSVLCDGCGENTADWEYSVHTWMKFCPKCIAAEAEADPEADREDWKYHHLRGE